MLFDDSNKGIFFVVVNWTSMGIVCNITKQGMGKDQLALIVFTVV